jgi:uracil-DNA glycosylase
VVGACGGYVEEQEGEPLCGPAGRKLRRGLEWAAAGRPFRYARWNVYNCRATKPSDTGKPFVVNRKPNQLTVKELRDCSSRWLFPMLRTTTAEVVLILGVDMDRFIMEKRFGGFHKSMGNRCLVPQTGIAPAGLPNEIYSYGKLYKVELS